MLKKYVFCTGTLLVEEIIFSIPCGSPPRPDTFLDSHLRAWLNVENSDWIFPTTILALNKYGFCTAGEIAFNMSCGQSQRLELFRAWLRVENSGWIFSTVMLKKYGLCTGHAFGWRNGFQHFMWPPSRLETALDSHCRANRKRNRQLPPPIKVMCSPGFPHFLQ